MGKIILRTIGDLSITIVFFSLASFLVSIIDSSYAAGAYEFSLVGLYLITVLFFLFIKHEINFYRGKNEK